MVIGAFGIAPACRFATDTPQGRAERLRGLSLAASGIPRIAVEGELFHGPDEKNEERAASLRALDSLYRPHTPRLSSSSHFALMPYSNTEKPVALPPGRARLSTKPAPTGSATCTNTIGTLRVSGSVPRAKRHLVTLRRGPNTGLRAGLVGSRKSRPMKRVPMKRSPPSRASRLQARIRRHCE